MGSIEQVVVEGEDVILPPKTKSKAVTFRWPPDLIDELHELADRQGHSLNEASERLMRWAVVSARAELDGAGPSKKKQ